MKYVFLLILLFSIRFIGNFPIANAKEFRNRCCDLGRESIRNNDNDDNICSNSYKDPNLYEKECQIWIKQCCQQEIDLQCELGVSDAYYLNTCPTNLNSHRNICCNQCLKMRHTSLISNICNTTNPIVEKHCCLYGIRDSEVVTEEGISIVASKNQYNICDIGGICAQICIPIGKSYKCDCKKDYTLMADKVSCKPKKTNPNTPKNKCNSDENICEQFCTEKSGGKFVCSCRSGYELNIDNRTCSDLDECTLGTHNCVEEINCINEMGSFFCDDSSYLETNENNFDSNCSSGYKFNGNASTCEDIDECEFDIICPRPQICINTKGSYYCYDNSTTTTTTTISSTTTTRLDSTTISNVQKKINCNAGLKYNNRTNSCEDLNECQNETPVCDTTENCFNSIGSYTCICKIGYVKDHKIGTCIDVNECQLGTHSCTIAQRCDNTIGSYLCARFTGCGTGYTLNYANGLCEDDDECALGNHNCRTLGSMYKCRNTMGSYRCDFINTIQTGQKYGSNNITIPTTTLTSLIPESKFTTTTIINCPNGYILDQTGYCNDMNECVNNPCPKGQKCINTYGSYYCISIIQCKLGYDLDPESQTCIDVNECISGAHTCNPTQICKNAPGYYMCECPSGHRFNQTNRQCEDIDECKFYTTCSVNAKCYNTIGSYKCRCMDGFRERGNNNCIDIDECKETQYLCEHNCVNMWGSYRCACNLGFTLNADNRTCSDVNECEIFHDKRLCIGTCENIPGSYRCTCPKGYRLGNDGRTCKDIDECEENICSKPNEICLNTRGGYKCYEIDCPPNYFRDPDHKGRCKRHPTKCSVSRPECKSDQFIYHYIALVSNLPLINGRLQFFQIKGPQWNTARAEFRLRIIHVTSAFGIQRADENYFEIKRNHLNTMQLFLLKPLSGPQEIQLCIDMDLYHGSRLLANIVSYIYILVSEYPF